MRWKQKPIPKHHDSRTRNVFLWKPWCWEGEWCWLERATIRERYFVYEYSGRGEWIKDSLVEDTPH